MAVKRPLGIIVISIISFIMGAYYSIAGILFLDIGGMLSGGFEGIFKGIGLLLLFLGALLIVMSLGLLLMLGWARKWASDFYGVMAGLALLLAFFDPWMIISFVLYFIFYFYLKSSRIKRAFNEHGYERPNVHDAIAERQHARGLHTGKPAASSEGDSMVSVEPEVNVPDNMILCPQCQTLNLKKDGACNVCASELEP